MKLTKPTFYYRARRLERYTNGTAGCPEFVYATWEELEADWGPRELAPWQVLLVDVISGPLDGGAIHFPKPAA